MLNSIISHRAAVPEDGRIYVPECIWPFLKSTLCARIENRADVGACVAFYLKTYDGKGKDVAFSEGYLCIGQMCSEAGIFPPLVWRASTNPKGSLLELLLHQDDHGGCYKAIR
ncbi:MAG: hypothetical protein QXM31_01560 [Candidatus Woesearchaeota archaeon]